MTALRKERELTDGDACRAHAPRPRDVAETGLRRNLLESLVAKHLYEGGVLDLRQLGGRLRLAGPVLEEILHGLRILAHVETRGVLEKSANTLRYGLTHQGRGFALDALSKSGYVGPAPVALADYARVVRAQSVHDHCVTHDRMHRLFADMVIPAVLLDRLGPAMHSGRPLFLYGPAGAGKTFVARRLARVFESPVLVPHAIAVDDSIVQVFDPVIHRPLAGHDAAPGVMLDEGHDPRYVLCERPAIVTGGELDLDMLEIRYEPATKQQVAPLQVKAANGIYVIDDLGRQRVTPMDLFNRWIVPLENGEDHLTLANGKRFPVPFDVLLVFSTNLNPRQLADEAFLRRIGHKIPFGPLARDDYAAIWQQVCNERGVTFDAEVLQYVFDELYGKTGTPLLACHPRDLLGLALDRVRYFNAADGIGLVARIVQAWDMYFVSPTTTTSSGDARAPSGAESKL